MRSAQPYQDDVAERTDTEFNLGLGSLLGIFFGLALICGLFLAFGYSIGHHNPPVQAASLPAVQSEKPESPAIAPKPSARTPIRPDETDQVVLPVTSTPDEATSPQSPVRSEPRSSNFEPKIPAALPEPPSAKPAGSIMVQIAAVKSAPDADALVSALRKNGFSATARNEAQDRLIHVQIGPFDTREEAKSMRQQLANAGYNAFIK